MFVDHLMSYLAYKYFHRYQLATFSQLFYYFIIIRMEWNVDWDIIQYCRMEDSIKFTEK